MHNVSPGCNENVAAKRPQRSPSSASSSRFSRAAIREWAVPRAVCRRRGWRRGDVSRQERGGRHRGIAGARAVRRAGNGADTVSPARTVHGGDRGAAVGGPARRLPVSRRVERLGARLDRRSGRPHRQRPWCAGRTTKPIRLNRGPNRFKVTYTSPPSADAYLRLYWSSPAIDWEPIPAGRCPGRRTDAALDRGQQLRTGRMLVLEYRCTRCQSCAEGGEALQMDAPSFEGIGLRRNQAWMARWIADPRALRPTARMPKLLHESEARWRRGYRGVSRHSSRLAATASGRRWRRVGG